MIEYSAPDSRLLSQLIEGDDEAFRELFRRHERPAYRVALALTNSTWDAEEVVGSAFLELWRKRESVRLVDDSVLPWLLVTVAFAAKNQLRGQRRYQRLLRKVGPPEEQRDHADEVAQVIEAVRIAGDVQDALSSLNARDASVVLLCLVQGLSTQHASVVLGLPEGTVKSRLSRAKARLRSKLSRYDAGSEEIDV